MGVARTIVDGEVSTVTSLSTKNTSNAPVSILVTEICLVYLRAEALQACTQGPRGAELAYADVQISQLGSKHAGYDLFMKYAAVEEQAAQMEEADHVLQGIKPKGPQHRYAC